MTPPEPEPDSLLRHRPFLLYFNARTCAGIAFQMIAVAVGWQMYEITGSAFDLGLVGLAQFLPAMVLMLVAGQVADRYDRRLILQICQIIEALAAASLAVASVSGWISREFILIALVFLGAARAFESTTMQTLLPTIVTGALFPRAVAGSSATTQVATIAGPALGGLLYSLGGPVVTYTLNAALYVSAALLLLFVHVRPLASTRPPITLKVFFAGVAFICENKIVLGVMTLDLFAVLLGGVTGMLPIFAKDVFNVGPTGLGLMRAAPAVGAILVMIVLVRWTFERHLGRIMFATVGCFGAAIVVFAVSRSFVLSLGALMMLGASDAISVVIRMTLIQIETPDEMRGRVSAVNTLFVSMSNQIGDFRAGMVAAWIGAVPAVLVGGIGTLLVVLASIKVFPELYNVQNFHKSRRE